MSVYSCLNTVHYLCVKPWQIGYKPYRTFKEVYPLNRQGVNTVLQLLSEFYRPWYWHVRRLWVDTYEYTACWTVMLWSWAKWDVSNESKLHRMIFDLKIFIKLCIYYHLYIIHNACTKTDKLLMCVDLIGKPNIFDSYPVVRMYWLIPKEVLER